MEFNATFIRAARFCRKRPAHGASTLRAIPRALGPMFAQSHSAHPPRRRASRARPPRSDERSHRAQTESARGVPIARTCAKGDGPTFSGRAIASRAHTILFAWARPTPRADARDPPLPAISPRVIARSPPNAPPRFRAPLCFARRKRPPPAPPARDAFGPPARPRATPRRARWCPGRSGGGCRPPCDRA